MLLQDRGGNESRFKTMSSCAAERATETSQGFAGPFTIVSESPDELLHLPGSAVRLNELPLSGSKDFPWRDVEGRLGFEFAGAQTG